MWPNLHPDLVTFTEEMFNGKLHFSCSVKIVNVNEVQGLRIS